MNLFVLGTLLDLEQKTQQKKALKVQLKKMELWMQDEIGGIKLPQEEKNRLVSSLRTAMDSLHTILNYCLS